MTAADPGCILRRALIGWGLGHLTIGRTTLGYWLLAAELTSVILVALLTVGLADTSLYLVPFLAGVAFIVAWAWQAVAAYRSAQALQPARPPTPERSPAAAIGWLSIPLLVWGTGFWVVAGHSATPAAVLDDFVTDWSSGDLERTWSRFLGIFPGTELVQVADERILVLELEARPVELPGGGQIGAVRWELVSARS